MKDYLRSQLWRYGCKYSEEPFKLKSGKESNHYIDCRPLLLHQAFVRSAAFLIRSHIHLNIGKIDGIAGVVLGACPLVDEIVSQEYNTGIDNGNGRFWHKAYVRKLTKDHGTKNLIEMDFGLKMFATQNNTHRKPKIVLIEDVWTTGGSAIKATKILEDSGCEVCSVIVLVDREEENTSRPDFALFTLKDLIESHD